MKNKMKKFVLIALIIFILTIETGCSQRGSGIIRISNAEDSQMNGEYNLEDLDAVYNSGNEENSFHVTQGMLGGNIYIFIDIVGGVVRQLKFGKSEKAPYVDAYSSDDPEGISVKVDTDHRIISFNNAALSKGSTGETLELSVDLTYPKPREYIADW
jgi:hypothetical protein